MHTFVKEHASGDEHMNPRPSGMSLLLTFVPLPLKHHWNDKNQFKNNIYHARDHLFRGDMIKKIETQYS
jgi:hypothetical protein